MATRCKFRCTSVEKLEAWPKEKGCVYKAKFTAVYDGSPENKAFFDATPTGNLEIGTYKQDVFEVGKEYFVDLTIAVPVEA